MLFKRERDFLGSLCKGHIQDLVDEVGWTPLQCDIVKKTYIEFKSTPVICMEAGLSESQLGRERRKILEKFYSYLIYHKDAEIVQIFKEFFK